MYTDETIIPYGRYKFYKLKDIPNDYFLTIWENGGGNDPELKEYIKDNLYRFKLIGKYAGEIVLPQKVTFICNKITFPTKRDAQDSLKKIRADKSDHKKPLRAYECPRCSGWHLTSKEVDEYKAEKQRRSQNKTL